MRNWLIALAAALLTIVAQTSPLLAGPGDRRPGYMPEEEVCSDAASVMGSYGPCVARSTLGVSELKATAFDVLKAIGLDNAPGAPTRYPSDSFWVDFDNAKQ
jgi:hypothetical protein